MTGLSLLIACAVGGACAPHPSASSSLMQAVSGGPARSSTSARRTQRRNEPATASGPADAPQPTQTAPPGERLAKSRELARVDTRVRNRVENRIRNRIDESYDPLQGTDRPFVAAGEEAVQQRQRVTPR